MSQQKKCLNIISPTNAFVEELTSTHVKTGKYVKIIEIENIISFLDNLAKGKYKLLKLNDFTEIKLSSHNLPDSLVKKVIQTDTLMDVLEEIRIALTYPIKWHVPPFFSCRENCKQCCRYTYFLPHELDSLANGKNIRKALSLQDEGMWTTKQVKHRCIFFNLHTPFRCNIHSIRPVRCKIYPFFPIIYKNRIHIFFESQLRMKNSKEKREMATSKTTDNYHSKICPGIESKVNIKKQVNKDIVDYVTWLLDVPLLAKTVVIDPKRVLIDKNTFKYKKNADQTFT